jgi:hypothetical protein
VTRDHVFTATPHGRTVSDVLRVSYDQGRVVDATRVVRRGPLLPASRAVHRSALVVLILLAALNLAAWAVHAFTVTEVIGPVLIVGVVVLGLTTPPRPRAQPIRDLDNVAALAGLLRRIETLTSDGLVDRTSGHDAAWILVDRLTRHYDIRLMLAGLEATVAKLEQTHYTTFGPADA